MQASESSSSSSASSFGVGPGLPKPKDEMTKEDWAAYFDKYNAATGIAAAGAARMDAMQQQLDSMKQSQTIKEAAAEVTMNVTKAFMDVDVQKEAGKAAAVETVAAIAMLAEATFGRGAHVSATHALKAVQDIVKVTMYKLPTVFHGFFNIDLKAKTVSAYEALSFMARNLLFVSPHLLLSSFTTPFTASAFRPELYVLKETKASPDAVVRAGLQLIEKSMFEFNGIKTSAVDAARLGLKKDYDEEVAGQDLEPAMWRVALNDSVKITASLEKAISAFKTANVAGVSVEQVEKYTQRLAVVYEILNTLKAMLQIIDSLRIVPAVEVKEFVREFARAFAGLANEQLSEYTWLGRNFEDGSQCSEPLLMKLYKNIVQTHGKRAEIGKSKAAAGGDDDPDEAARDSKKKKETLKTSAASAASTPNFTSAMLVSLGSAVAQAMQSSTPGSARGLAPTHGYGTGATATKASAAAAAVGAAKPVYLKRADTSKTQLQSLEEMSGKVPTTSDRTKAYLSVCMQWVRGGKCPRGDACEHYHCCPLCWRDGKPTLECCNNYKVEHAKGHSEKIEADKETK